MFQHLKALNLRSVFDMLKRGVTLTLEAKEILRRFQHRIRRLELYRRRNASYPFCGERQRQRYLRNGMREQQRNSHKPPALQPRHIFGQEIAA